jgi:hypothetical protein
MECLRGAKPLFFNILPFMIGVYIHIMERGIKRVRLRPRGLKPEG